MQNYLPLFDRQGGGPDYIHRNYHPYLPLLRHDEEPTPHAPPPYLTTIIGRNDVLLGRGGATNSHSGNKAFRGLVKAHQDEYLNAKKKDKPAVAARVVERIRQQGGYFLRQHGTSQDGRHIYWVDVGDDRAKEKTCQALREGAPAILRQKRPAKSSTIYYALDADEAPTVGQPEKEKEQERKHDGEKLQPSEKPVISATDTSSWESSSSSIEDTVLRPWKRLLLATGWECEPISLHQLPPMERDVYLREFLPPFAHGSQKNLGCFLHKRTMCEK